MIDRTVELLLTAIVVGAIGIFSPTRLALTVVMLTGRRPWARALAFAAGSTAVFGMAALVGLLGVVVPGAEAAAPAINVVLGAAMITAAVAMLVVRRRRPTLPAPPSRRPLLTAAGIGAGVAIQSFGRLLLLVAGGYRIGSIANIGSIVANPLTGVAATALMVGIWQAPIWAPMALYVFRRERFDALERRAKPALDRIEGSIWGAVAVGAVGAWLLVQGLLA